MNPQKNSHRRSLTIGFLFGTIALVLFLGLLYQEDIQLRFQRKLTSEKNQPRGKLVDNTYTIQRKGRLNWKKGFQRQEPPRPTSGGHESIIAYLETRIETLNEELRQADMNESILNEHHNQQLVKLESQIDLKSQKLAEKINLIENFKHQMIANNEQTSSLKKKIDQLNIQLDSEKERHQGSEKLQNDLQTKIDGLTQQVQKSQNNEKVTAKLLKLKDDELLELTNQMDLLATQITQYEKEAALASETLQNDLQTRIEGLIQHAQQAYQLAKEAQNNEKIATQLSKEKDDNLLELTNQMNLLTAEKTLQDEATRQAKETNENKIAELIEQINEIQNKTMIQNEQLESKELEIASARDDAQSLRVEIEKERAKRHNLIQIINSQLD